MYSSSYGSKSLYKCTNLGLFVLDNIWMKNLNQLRLSDLPLKLTHLNVCVSFTDHNWLSTIA